ncbi:DNA adenine methylase [Clostridium sp. NSJ-6]|uniref:site-specific DNA-methyltransferase (adenine-specific) n=1 Tax=Clostridium hominis TaxID=2763036 RepID=A0ABR7DGU7_9CLOT|nr:DNA adenine methylase [Clostridium hominis]
MKTYSPLRYPGGKNKLTELVKQILDNNQMDNSITYIEPYAGGASVALNLLISNRVKKIIINDKDRSIYAFWYCVLNYTDELCEIIMDTDITIDEWYFQKEIQNNKNDVDLLSLGFSTLFLNRTNRSGILKAGVIGGINQDGNYKLDCRFNKEELVKKIKLISTYKKRIKLYNLDTLELLNTVVIGSKSKNFIFFDPPYYKKGSSLYMNFYNHNDHVELSKKIIRLRKHKWIVTYDLVDEIISMYSKFEKRIYNLQYSAQRRYKGSEVIFFSKNINTPNNDMFI